jgi:hypothetical protein
MNTYKYSFDACIHTISTKTFSNITARLLHCRQHIYAVIRLSPSTYIQALKLRLWWLVQMTITTAMINVVVIVGSHDWPQRIAALYDGGMKAFGCAMGE